ncbi:MAG: tRNA dihydrouridine(20/20a) synthase DusA [Betaproteobacteria bacterium]|nr:tRNA dihydrouridine(20/20a) synthase DusA [Betaproteobacteria bacterium]
MSTATRSPHRLCTAPMMDWSDRHCRYFFRLLAPHARLYTEMVTTGALLHGDVERHLRFDRAESPVALQLGGSEPDALAACARLGAAQGYDEINLNCGCPSERVQQGAFGACLMREPELVADCVRAMQEVVRVPVTVKHRLGVDAIESFDFVERFVKVVADAGCDTFIVHARNAILSGLSPKGNRSVPRLRYDDVYRLKREFPQLAIVVNGGVDAPSASAAHLTRVDGVMLGRAAYHDSYLLAALDAQLFGGSPASRADVVRAMASYAAREAASGTPLRAIVRHMLGLYQGQPRARLWRRLLSDPSRLASHDPRLLLEALALVEGNGARELEAAA